MVEYGGNLKEMMQRLGMPDADWLDLSTGINPHPWAAPTPPPAVWNRLPERDDGLHAAAQEYFRTEALMPVPGAQAALAILPWLRTPSRVGVIAPSFAEQGTAWKRAGHEVVPLSSAQLAGGAGTAFDVLIIINPNNPDGTLFEPETLLEWRTAIASRGGWLVVDEAFIDPTPESSVAPYAPLPGLIVLRSFSRFFGLAGLRIGFAMGETTLLQHLEAAFGPWSVSGPARWIACQALRDVAWHARMRSGLQRESARLEALLSRFFPQRAVGTPYFRTILTPDAARIHECLARHAILVRLLDRQEGLRFGLPGCDEQWQRLESALDEVVAHEISQA